MNWVGECRTVCPVKNPRGTTELPRPSAVWRSGRGAARGNPRCATTGTAALSRARPAPSSMYRTPHPNRSRISVTFSLALESLPQMTMVGRPRDSCGSTMRVPSTQLNPLANRAVGKASCIHCRYEPLGPAKKSSTPAWGRAWAFGKSPVTASARRDSTSLSLLRTAGGYLD